MHGAVASSAQAGVGSPQAVTSNLDVTEHSQMICRAWACYTAKLRQVGGTNWADYNRTGLFCKGLYERQTVLTGRKQLSPGREAHRATARNILVR